ncbi:MAG: glycosyltransferase [Actinomycetota bacterium]
MIEWLNKNNYIKNALEIDNRTYDVFIREKIRLPGESAKIVVVSFQPNKEASELLRLCIKSIKKFTDAGYELWIVDNNSPEEFIKWLDDVEGINIAFIRTEPEGGASYANGLALEAAVRLIDPKTKYFVSFHEDVVVCRYGWLDYMLSKMNEKTKAVGFRLTKARVPEGVLHVCGYIIDLQVFKELNLSFLPRLPEFDAGDKAIYELRKNGYDLFYTPNTFDDPDLIKLIPETLEIRNLNVTRSFNDKDEIIYMHLGRGIPKVKGEYRNKEKSSAEQWSTYIRSNLFSEPIAGFSDQKFIKNNLDLFSKKANILYLGKENKYLKKYRFKMKYSEDLPEGNEFFNCIIYSEITGSLKDIGNLLERLYNRLEREGILLITNPFLSDKNVKQFEVLKKSYEWASGRLWNIGFREVKVITKDLANNRIDITGYGIKAVK